MLGLTGNLGSGKSTVRKMLERLGARGIDADELAHVVMQRGSPAWSAILATFGADILRFNGEIDRKKLGARVFANPEALRKLEAIVHPAVGELIKGIVRECKEPVVVIEAIKLVEAGMHKWCDALWVVTCRPEVATERVMRNRHMSAEDARARLAAQGPIADKLRLANIVIDNSGDERTTLALVERAWEQSVRPNRGRPKSEWLSQPQAPQTDQATSDAQVRVPPINKEAQAAQSAPTVPPEPTSLDKGIGRQIGSIGPREEEGRASAKPTSPQAPSVTAKPKGLLSSLLAPIEVRRAKRGDLDALGAVLAKSQNRGTTMSREQLLTAFGQRGYRIAVRGDRIVALASWEAENLVAVTREIWTESAEIAQLALRPLFELIEQEARALQCEVSLVLPELRTPDYVLEQVSVCGYKEEDLQTLYAVWQQVAEQHKPGTRRVWVKRLRQDLVTTPM